MRPLDDIRAQFDKMEIEFWIIIINDEKYMYIFDIADTAHFTVGGDVDSTPLLGIRSRIQHT
jgi:hypothetical protein